MTYAQDAANWSGTPWVSDGNIEPTKEQRGNLSDLVKKGFIQIERDDAGTFIVFTETGREYAVAHGVDISWWSY